MIRVVIAACVITLGTSGAFAARSSDETHTATPRADYQPNARPLHAPKAQVKTAPPPRKPRRKKKAVRHPDVFYRWSAEQLMFGGVNPSRVGKDTDDITGRTASKSAASSR
ncbi:hypothetical protein G3N95_32290 [Paraburkholderia sp. Tr-20389]|uniref:hypothetical protein n=1 Tax=Paraburkholderia sp. Tr-20389 TaxID=2703903 RepID=UPI001980B39E|nr:hypothetical protein [Paraburkholderia sp. Tr-20389]MBN3757644.1 hypothetical protein [Paraburkholderia sp. Tr-20389]